MKLITAGRTDVRGYFKLSGMRENSKNPHTPFIVFEELYDQFDASLDRIEVRLIQNPADLLNFPDDTKVMAQWPGKWSSDFFQFTISQLKEYIAERPKEPHQVI